MKKKLAILLLLPVLLLAIGTFLNVTLNPEPKQSQAPVVTVQQPTRVELDADKLFTLINEERTKAGIKPLQRDTRLDQSAGVKAKDMFDNNYFDHGNPTTGVRGYTLIPLGLCSLQSENIAEMYDNPDMNIATVKGWMDSQKHREAILDTRYDLSGLSVSGNKVVQHFCISN